MSVNSNLIGTEESPPWIVELERQTDLECEQLRASNNPMYGLWKEVRLNAGKTKEENETLMKSDTAFETALKSIS